jgi:hypothetical protein
MFGVAGARFTVDADVVADLVALVEDELERLHAGAPAVA